VKNREVISSVLSKEQAQNLLDSVDLDLWYSTLQSHLEQQGVTVTESECSDWLTWQGLIFDEPAGYWQANII
jgi:hypothetical protein